MSEPGALTGRRLGPKALQLVLLLGLIGALAWGVLARPEQSTQRNAPDLELEKLGATGSLELTEFRGKPLVVNFFASWCPPCVDEMPEFQATYKALKGRVAFLGINIRDDPKLAERLVMRTGVTYPVVQDPDGNSITDFLNAVENPPRYGMPLTVFVGPDGTIKEMVIGPVETGALADKISRNFGIDVPT